MAPKHAVWQHYHPYPSSLALCNETIQIAFPSQDSLTRTASYIDCSSDDLDENAIDERTKPKADGELLDDFRHRRKRVNAAGSDPDEEADIVAPITFSNLPTELHRCVFAHIESLVDVVGFSVTSQYFWALGRDYIHGMNMRALGQWAGQNIVCMGLRIEPRDFPPGLFSAEEVAEPRQKTVEIPFDEDYPENGAFPAVRCTLYHFTLPAISRPQAEYDLSRMSQSAVCECLERCRERQGDECKDAGMDVAHMELWRVEDNTYLAEGQPWILRNLTAKQFVRAEAITLKPEYIHGASTDVLGFGEVVMARIAWSSSSYISMEDSSNITKGVWAGHCFDITTLARHRDEVQGSEMDWIDVSEEVAREIAGIWEAEYGPGWRETICNKLA